MKLKRLDIIGFKSFADKTQVFFDKGVTCVVGPNGCGKSNISDSIRWVLGERSAKMLRGAKMEDVIFNGTQFRKPTALAEVSLTIDNEDRGLPIDYNEVTITRRLYRSGESEYLLNKTQCRLRDIQDLIADTGIGSNSYSMIEQGRIDYILSADPEERRFLIEEAAGISKFKTKKTEAIRKLERTEQNRERLTDIIQEVHKNIQYAERQAKRAERYKVQLEELKKLEITKAYFDIDQIQTKKQSIDESRQKLESEMSQLEEQIQISRSAQENLSETLRGILDRFAEKDGIRHGLQSKIDQMDQQLKFNQEKRLELASRGGEIHQETKQLEERIAASKIEIDQKRNELEKIASERDTAESMFKASKEKMESLESAHALLKEQQDNLKNSNKEIASKINMIQSGFHRLEAFLETNKEQREKRQLDQSRGEEDKHRLAQEIGSKNEELLANQTRLSAITGEITKLQTIESDAKAEHSRLVTQAQAIQNEVSEKKARHELLKQARQSFEEQKENLLNCLPEERRNCLQSLESIIRIKPGYEWALELALDALVHAMIIDSGEEATEVVDKILKNEITSLSVLVKSGYQQLEPVAPRRPKHPMIHHALSELVTISEGYDDLFRPLLENVFVAGSSNARNMIEELLPLAGGCKFVTTDGIVLGPHHAVHFKNSKLFSDDSIFQQQSELEELEAELEKKGLKLSALQHSITEVSQSIEQIQSDLQKFEASKVDCLVQKETLDAAKNNLQHQEEQCLTLIKEIRSADETSMAQEAKVKEQILEIEDQLRESQHQESELREQLEKLSIEMDQSERTKATHLHELAENKASFENIDERTRLLEEALQYLVDHQTTDKERIEALNAEHLRIEEKTKELQAEDGQIEGERQGCDSQRREAEIALEMIRQEKNQAEEALAEAQAKLESLQENQRKVGEGFHQSEMKVMDLEYQEKTIHERLQQTYQLSLHEYSKESYPLETTEDEMNEQVAKLRKKVESIGTVNLLAIEEYDELKERYDFLMTQQKDLEDARTQLLETIRKINKTTKSLFETTFNNVQEAFQEYYSTLFRGGQAKLVLVDESNPLESGIDIVVRPPGKKLQHISLLSGGEKALTAIALLFALFKIKPSPYCVLDEVDAPLDEANIDRFLGALKSFLTMTQFIIVTHNRKTIAMGDSLYGVTMEEPGISKLVSVKVGHDSQENRLEEEVNETELAQDEVISATESEV